MAWLVFWLMFHWSKTMYSMESYTTRDGLYHWFLRRWTCIWNRCFLVGTTTFYTEGWKHTSVRSPLSIFCKFCNVFLVSVCRKSETQDQGASSQSSHPSPRYHRDFGCESLLLKSCTVIPADERSSIHEANINILNAKTEQQLKEDRVICRVEWSVIQIMAWINN